MSYKATAWAYDMKLTSPMKPVLVVLADMADESGSCFPGQERISAMTGLSVRTVARALGKLQRLGLIERQRRFDQFGHRTSDRYHLKLTVNVPESLPVRLTTGQRAYRSEMSSLPVRNVIPTGHSDRVITREPLENHQGEPPLFCSKHPNGANGNCGGCADARRLHTAWERAQKHKPTVPGIITPDYSAECTGRHKWTKDGTCAVCPARREAVA